MRTKIRRRPNGRWYLFVSMVKRRRPTVDTGRRKRRRLPLPRFSQTRAVDAIPRRTRSPSPTTSSASGSPAVKTPISA
jgi:hypothetical protein